MKDKVKNRVVLTEKEKEEAYKKECDEVLRSLLALLSPTLFDEV